MINTITKKEEVDYIYIEDWGDRFSKVECIKTSLRSSSIDWPVSIAPQLDSTGQNWTQT